MKTILKHAHRVKQGLDTGRAFAIDPMAVLFDRVLAVIVQSFVPMPLIGELVVAFKKPILVMLGSVVVITITFLVMAAAVIVSPVGFLATVTLPGVATDTGAEAVPIEALAGYKEVGFTDTAVPNKDPFGGGGSSITAYFHDASYYATYQLVHEGVDLVPSNAYYANNQAYQKVHTVVMFATISGTARSYTDSYGALTVEISNTEGTIKTVYKHLKQIIMQEGSVHAGEPVGVMGDTGFAFGEHLHYEVRLQQGGEWVAVNPLPYLR